MKLWRQLFEHYQSYHAYGPPRLKYMGYLGVVSYAAFYLVRFTRPNANLYDDLGLRLIAVGLFALLALRDYWPERLRPYYIGFSYLVLLYCLPGFSVLTALQRGGGLPAISNGFIILCLLVLLTDWRNTLVMLLAGTALASLVYYLTSPNPRIPMDLVAQLPAYGLILLGGNLFKFSTEQIDAERKLRATQALAGSIAHEMRNPLSQIRHNLERMQQALPQPSTSPQPQTLGVRQVDALYRHLAESELAVTRGLQVIAMTLDEVSAKPLDSASFSYLSAADVCRKAVQEYGYESDEDRARVSVEVREDFSFRGDETAYLFVLFNLIKNALYYLPLRQDGRVVITVDRQQVLVRDNGPGVPADVRARMFEPFRSVGKTGGTGLGLAYCQRVMRAFGGDISCESVLGEYTQFNMRLPPVNAQEAQAHSSAALQKARDTFHGKRLLVVDDDAALRTTTRHKLRLLEAHVDEAANGQRALELLARHKYDLVVLDLNMPVLDGYALAERIRDGDVPANRDICIVAYTSEPAHLASVKTQKAGMDGFVGKPCAQLPLLQALVHAFEHPAPRTRPEDAVLAGRQVLLADDNPYNRKAMTAYLHQAGVKVTEAAHGQAVLELLRERSGWDAILMDINMPGMSGLEAAQAIRQSTLACRDVPIIALTAHSDEAMVAAAQAAGINAFLTKPVDAYVLYEELRQLVAAGVSRAAAAPLAATPGGTAATGADLLDLKRLESYRRIGMLDELLSDYFPEAARLIDRLDAAAQRQDLQGGLEALHSLLGMSGEAGAAALHQLVRRIYVPMVEERCWPPSDGWLEQIRALAIRTDAALTAYGREQARTAAI
ncbi:response regulator [Caenimonas terrae]|uniref:histidine kinase n=1 Tax=Caenimonas terrae TaxID=696074 RepID=A0ABW0NHS9_9BURK